VAPSAPFSPIAPPSLFPGADRHAVFMVLKHAKVQFESNRELQVVSVQPHTHTHTHTHVYPVVHSCICECAILQKALCLLGGRKRAEGLQGSPLASGVLNSNFWPSLASKIPFTNTHTYTHRDREPCGANVCVCLSMCLCCVPCRGD